ncbi:MAG: MotA/TolQ/ExbB proton channel family protein [bacterium]
MDICTVGGCVGATIAMIASIMLEEAGIVGSGYMNIPATVIIGAGTFLSTMATFDLKHNMNVGNWFKMAIFNKAHDEGELITTILNFAQKARREGLLALEGDIEGIHDRFLRKGIQLVVDGVDPELIESVLDIDTANMRARHKFGEEWFMCAGGMAPTMGILGAIMGLTGALSKMGGGDMMTTIHSLAIAFVASFYGVAIANLVLIPVAGKLKFLDHEEAFVRDLIMTGVLAIQAGDNPRIVEEKLKAFFSPTTYPVKSLEEAGG